MAKEWLPVRIRTIKGTVPLTFTPHIQLGERFVVFAQKDQPPEHARFERLVKDGVKKVFIDQGDEPQYLKYLDNLVKESLNDRSVPLETRAATVRDVSMDATERTIKKDFDERGFNASSMAMEALTSLIINEAMALGKTLGLDSDHSIHQHSLNTAALSIGLANKLGIKDSAQLKALSMGALLHDIGKTALPIDPVQTEQAMSEETRRLFRNHPSAGLELLQTRPFITPEILEIVRNHEEHPDGSGFPRALKDTEISQSVQIVSLCNIYDRHITVEKLSRSEAMRLMTEDRSGAFSGDLFKALRELLTEQSLG